VSRYILKFTPHPLEGIWKAVSPGGLVSVSIQLLFPATTLATLLVVSLMEKKKFLILPTNLVCLLQIVFMRETMEVNESATTVQDR